ncbi:nuclear transport factor 2 family protein [Pectobacterium quasiaquaticum]|uniref:Nuclear transport factor 2 family protein n=1 Tax=Pectobacterium quasiaquaticum TaxID=2774015 RepID=A0A9Q2IFG3_9GAMM|nr:MULTISPECIES: nuclear transport factor 2 family protein [Pectobacterium]MBE5202256.1 nuclear transport factor 2 family protein [Pectobacterium quasiaquaticum]MBE5209087.1 nuclear transport factor 2 family protein [Pectobacterium quasiaquaticum]MBE5213199.1 nuclear transport factor 2 family protein [Pectobacterium quasiaquaticum]MBE5221685.1 nuclear transport factor 2 family protein [Pectobacterium quasiaquaticum]MBE5224151.1 nuclear transport factor 2 family protein [Pectobacterium quasiaqu
MTDLNSHSIEGIQLGLPHEAAQAGLKEWHRIVESLDWKALPDLLTEDVVFRNPATIESYHGKETMVAILGAVFSVFKDFTYLRHFGKNTGYVLEFSARVGDDIVFGVDLIEFSTEGKITDFMVMMRPANVVLNLSVEAGKRLASASKE